MLQKENITQERTEDVISEIGMNVPIKAEDVVPLNYKLAFANFTEEEQKEIVQLSKSIDVRNIDKVMDYGAVALNNTFNQCGEFLKKEKGSQADQMVISRVIELSKKASDSYDDFNLVLKEPNFFQKLFLKILGGSKDRTQKIQDCAVTNYQLLFAFRKSCESWIEILQDAMGEIYDAALSDVNTACLVEKFLIAGNMAQDRIKNELQDLKQKYEATGITKYSEQYDLLDEGAKIFEITMNNLNNSRSMYKLSLGQLKLIKESNRNMQIVVRTQKNNVMAVIGQQMRNAVLNAKNQQVLEGKKAISRLGDELIKDISKTASLTAEETERLLYQGFCNAEASKEAILTVINGLQAIEKIATESLPKMKANTLEISELAKQLEPYINPVTSKSQPALISQESSSSVNSDDGILKF